MNMKLNRAQAAVEFLLGYMAEGEIRIDENFGVGTADFAKVHTKGNDNQVGVVFRDGDVGAVSLVAAALTIAVGIEAIDRRIRNAEPEDKVVLMRLKKDLLQEVVGEVLVELPTMVQMREDGSGIVF